MSATAVIAILDIGKTNKKLFLFDDSYRIVREENTVLAETTDEDGYPCEDLNLLNNWVRDVISKSAKTGEYQIRAINFSAYGASLVHTGENGKPVLPLYNYLKPFPEILKRQFYERYGGEMMFSLQTASPVLGNLNAGMQLYRIKNERPEQFSTIKYSLHLPQYLSWFLTGTASSDLSSIGCHTGLWNFSQNNYHEWVYREPVIDKLPSIQSADKVYPLNASRKKISDLPDNCVAGIGLHDSSAAVIPYLETFSEPFVLISTGTWCISMNPFNREPLTIEELDNDCLCYLTHTGQQVKASRLFAGHDHDVQVNRLSVYFQKDKNYYQSVQFNPETVSRMEKFDAASSGRHLSALSSSAFAQRDLSFFADFEEACHRLMMDIMKQQTDSVNLIMSHDVKRIFVDGGFSKNKIYMQLLAERFPLVEVFAATVAQASAIGAAMAIHRFWNAGSLPAELITLRKYVSMGV